MESRLRASPEQFHLMLGFMESHGDLSRPQPGLQGKIRGEQKWKELSEMLNSVGGSGVHKTVEKWKRVWSDWKTKTKKKASLINRHMHGTGGGPANSKVLSPLELRIISIMGISSIQGQEALQEAGFEIPTHSQAEENILSPVNVIEINAMDHEAYTLPTRSEKTPSPQPGPSQPVPNIVNRPTQEATSPGSCPSTPRRRRQRRILRCTPFERATSQFVAIEEGRLRLESDRHRSESDLESRRLKIDQERLQFDQERLRVEAERIRMDERRSQWELELNRNIATLKETTKQIYTNLQELMLKLQTPENIS